MTYAPSAIPPQIIAARVLSQRLHNAEELAQTIKLEYTQNSILVEVAGLSSRTFPEQFQYSFFLKNSKARFWKNVCRATRSLRPPISTPENTKSKRALLIKICLFPSL